MDRRTVALGIAAVVAVVAAVAVTVANGHGASPKHKATASYITIVDSIQQQMRVQLTKTAKAFRAFAHGKVDPKLAPELAEAEVTLQALERRLVALPAPPPAARLRTLLVKLARAQVALARRGDAAVRVRAEVRCADSEGRQVAGAELSRGLAKVNPPKTHKIRGTKKQIAAGAGDVPRGGGPGRGAASRRRSTRTTRSSRRSISSYGRSAAPIVLRPGFERSSGPSRPLGRAGAALAAELRKTDRSDVAVLGRRFTIASRSATTVAAQKTQIASIKAYNRAFARSARCRAHPERVVAAPARHRLDARLVRAGSHSAY